MRYKFDTRKRGGKHFVVGFHLAAIRNDKLRPLEVPNLPQIQCFDENGKYQFVVDIMANGAFAIRREMQDLSIDELERNRCAKVVQLIGARYSIFQELALLRRQVLGLENKGWDDYVAFVEQATKA